MKNNIVEILLVEDNTEDAERTIRALKKNHLANHLLHLRNGEEALELLFSRKISNLPKLILLDIKSRK